MFTTDKDMAEKMMAIRSHGGLQRHHHPYLGMNGRMDTLQAAIVLAKLPFFQNEVEERERIGARYSELLNEICDTPKIAVGNTHVYAQYTIRHAQRDKLASKLKEQNIPIGIYYPKCLHEQPVFEPLGYKLGDFPVSEAASREVISLPMHPFLTDDEQLKVVDAINGFSC